MGKQKVLLRKEKADNCLLFLKAEFIMYVLKELVTDEECIGKKNTILRKIRMNAGMLDTYLVCLSKNNDIFDIIDCSNLKQKGYPKKDLYILGIAKGKESAMELAAKLVVSFSEIYGMQQFKNELLVQKDTLFRRY